ncbi:MAG: PAS domain S-box protein, partial [Nitrospirales bacterium]
LDAAFVRIWLLNPDTHVLELQASAGLYTHLDGPHSRIPIGHLKIGQVAAEKKPHLTNAVIGDPRIPEQAWAKREGLVAFAGYPLVKNDEVLGVLGVFAKHTLTDVTMESLQIVSDRLAMAIERQQALYEYQKLARRNEQILASAGEGIYGIDLDGQTTFVNPAGAKLLGYTPQELIGRSMHTIIHHTKTDGSPYPQKECPMYTAFTDGTIHKVEDEVLWRKDGTSFPVEYSSMPIWQDGNLAGAVVTFQDVTERKQAEKILRATEQMYRQILDSIPDMVLVKDRNFRILWANKAFRSYYDMTNEELKGIQDSPINDPSFTKQYNKDDSYVFNTGNILDIPEESVTRHDGQVALFHTIKAPLFAESGEVVKSVGVSRDITERKQVEELIRKGERKFQAIYDQAPTGIGTMDSISGQFTEINQKFCAITGYSKEEMLNRTFQDITHPDDLQADLDQIQKLLAGQINSFYMEKRYFRKDGEVIWVNLTCVPLWLEPTDPRLHLAMVEDITHRKKAEKILKESEERYRTLYEDNPSMYFTVAQDGKILSVNQFGAQQLGYSVEELIGQPVIEVFLEDDKPLVQEHFNACLQGFKTLYFWELRKQRKDGTVLWVREVARTIQGEDGKPVVLIVCEDITERKQTEERLRQSEAKETDALRQSDKLKSALLSSVSHELRTPLTTMKGSVSSIIGKAPSNMAQEQQALLKGIDTEIDYMSQLVNNLLDMSQIEAGTLIPHKEWHLLEDLVEGALRRTEQTLDTRAIDIHIPENVPPVFVDPVQIQQVLINLIDNAVKYSLPASPIRLNIRVEAQNIAVEASNEGEPIQLGDLERIFDRFYRRPPPRQQPIHGTGLGLAICKGIVEAHGGRIWAESIEKKVTITFTIPTTEHMASFSLEGRHKSQREL